MEQWTKIRLMVEHEGLSIREVQRRTGLHYRTIKRILANPEPPPFDCPERAKPKIGPFLERIADIVTEDAPRKKKQRHTAKRIFERIQEEGYTGGYTAVPIRANSPTVSCNCKVTICSRNIFVRCVGPTRRGSLKGWSSSLD